MHRFGRLSRYTVGALHPFPLPHRSTHTHTHTCARIFRGGGAVAVWHCRLRCRGVCCCVHVFTTTPSGLANCNAACLSCAPRPIVYTIVPHMGQCRPRTGTIRDLLFMRGADHTNGELLVTAGGGDFSLGVHDCETGNAVLRLKGRCPHATMCLLVCACMRRGTTCSGHIYTDTAVAAAT